ncbi:HAD hydrolase-like protein [Gordonia zhaorongruii]|uniref:HAD hydrolase-like protein n=1 Tax=Gordonia zhaorongruii TaxID=2597659 RepID=UPI0010522B97|nr:HAD hydrolase-like protein [Gordonia zhaorongruii]
MNPTPSTGPPSPGPPSAHAAVLLFDLDGTITDSYPGITASFLYALEQLGVPRPDDDFLRSIVGPPLLESMVRMGLSRERAEDGIRAYRERYDVTGWLENSVFDGMASLLADLAADRRRVAVATSKNQVMARRILDHFGLSDRFEFVGGASEDSSRRSKAHVIGHVLAALDVDPAAAPVLMIGDRSHDIDGAAAFRVPAIGVRWGYAHAGELEAALQRAGAAQHEPRIAETIPDLRKVLGV